MERSAQLKTSLENTYLHLRRGMGILAFLFPFLLWLGAFLYDNTGLQGSLSAYYFTSVRNIFVGVLCAIGLFLYLYKGDYFGSKTRNDKLKNSILNLAGICAIGIALFPADIVLGSYLKPQVTFVGIVHIICAIIFFLAIAAVCVFLSAPDAQSNLSERQKKRYVIIYKSCGFIMTICVILAVAVMLAPDSFKQAFYQIRIIFIIEIVSILAFSGYWIAKSNEIDQAISWLPWVGK